MALNNSSLSFNGTTQYATAPATATIRNLGSFAFAAWFKVGTNSVRTNQHAYVERQGTGKLIRFRFTPIAGKLQFGFSAVDGRADTAYTFNTKWDDNWHHASFSARLGGEKPTYEITLDGVTVLQGTLVVPANTDKISDTAPLGVSFGNWNSGSGYSASTAWHGLLDDVAIFDGGLNQGTVNTYFSSHKRWDEQQPSGEPVDENMIMYWPFDENTGTTATDKGSTVVDTTQTNPPVHGPVNPATLSSSAMWTIDRPYIGNGLLDTTTPSTPTSPATTGVNADGFTASWGASTDNVWVQFYMLQVSEFANFQSVSSYNTGRLLSKKITGLLPATNYYWRVQAYDAALNASGYTTVQSLTTPPVGDIYPPSAPTNLTASFVTHSSFRISFTPSASVDAVGYRVDVSEFSDFRSYLTDFRNQDIGNITFVDIFGVHPLTSYYVRIRTYDAFDNESNDSVSLRVNTPRQPDITPPLVATIYDATAITATSATLNWAEGVDDTKVLGYYVDISTSPTFQDRVLANGIFWDDLDVGAVTSYRVEGLTPNTVYYYRLRAYDDAGNIAPNVEEPVSFTTLASSIYEGGFIEVEEPMTGWRENAVADVNYFYITPTTTGYVSFDLRSVVGTLSSAVLRFMPREFTSPTTYGSVTIRASAGTISDTPTGTGIDVSITQPNEYMEVDISSLLTSGTAQYVVSIAQAATDPYTGYIDTGIELANFNQNEPSPPLLIVLSDPLSSTQPLDIIPSVVDLARNNLCTNPSFEVDTSGWTTIGTVGISRVAGGTDGSYALRLIGAGASVGIAQSGIYSPVSGNSGATFSLDVTTIDGAGSYQLRMRAFDIDGNPISYFATQSGQVNVGRTKRLSVSGTTPENAASVRCFFYNMSGTAFTCDVDNVLIEESAIAGAAFTGNTPNAEWTGTANLSTSRLYAPTLKVISPYLGDNNENNTVTAYFKRSSDIEWIPVRHPITVNRAIKQYQSYIGPAHTGYNLITNPSFEVSDAYWTGGTRDNESFFAGEWGYRVDSSPYVAQHTKFIPIDGSTTYTTQMRIRPDEEVNATLIAEFFDIDGNSLLVSSSDTIYGDGTQSLVTVTATSPAAAVDMQIRVEGNGPFGVDAAQVNLGNYLPYRDGDSDDALWEGRIHDSTTGLLILNEESYDVRFDYADPEGFFDATDDLTFSISDTLLTPPAPDDMFHIEELVLIPTTDSIEAQVHFTGDDNGNSTARIEFRRTDLSSWSELRPIYHREHGHVHAYISNLRPGTSYTVRAIITDPDGVTGAINNTVTESTTTLFTTNATSGESHISFAGFVLQGREDGKIAVNYHDAFGFPERRVRIEDLPRLDGATQMQALWGRRNITVRGFITGDTREELDEIASSLKRALEPHSQRLIIDTMTQRGRFYYATCENLDIAEDAEVNISHLTWEAQFVCADPFAYDVDETLLPKFTTPNNNSVALTNDGDVSVNPRFEVTTTSAYRINFTIINTSTGERIAPKTTIISGDRIVIDSERRSVLKNGVEIDYAGGFPRLASGGNVISFEVQLSLTATSATTVNAQLAAPTIAVETRWRNKYL